MPTLVRPATKPAAKYADWNPLYPQVVEAFAKAAAPLPAFLTLEHVGSTALPGCGGKPTIDLLALYADGSLEPAKAFLLGLGFAKQGPEFANAWPENRPMYLGWFSHGGTEFLLYIHVVASTSDEVRRFRTFKERLLGSPALLAEYCETKRAIIAGGVTDTDVYAAQKRPFMHKALGADHALKR